MPTIDSIYLSTTIIHAIKNNILSWTATGFFFKDRDNLFLTTNKHVIYGDDIENGQPQIDSIKLVLHTNAQNISENEEVVIPLFNAGNKIWLEHDNKKADVVLIPVNLDRNRYVLHILDESYIESSNLDIKIEKIFVMGYPFGWYDNVNNLPITRIGHLSSPFKVPFQNKPFMLGDVQTHKGMSGGPVLMYLKDFVTIDANGNRTMNIGASRTLLVGINSATVNWPIGNETVLSGLIIIWFPELILEILQQN